MTKKAYGTSNDVTNSSRSAAIQVNGIDFVVSKQLISACQKRRFTAWSLTTGPVSPTEKLAERLSAIGAVLIDGPKGCGKTETANRVAHSTVRFDTDANARALVGLNPKALFARPTPILFDEWQRAPEMWDHVRRHVDDVG